MFFFCVEIFVILVIRSTVSATCETKCLHCTSFRSAAEIIKSECINNAALNKALLFYCAVSTKWMEMRGR